MRGDGHRMARRGCPADGPFPVVVILNGFRDTGWNTTMLRQGISGEKVRLLFRQMAQPRIDAATSVLVVLILAALGD